MFDIYRIEENTIELNRAVNSFQKTLENFEQEINDDCSIFKKSSTYSYLNSYSLTFSLLLNYMRTIVQEYNEQIEVYYQNEN